MATRQEAMRRVATTHGMSGTPAHKAWKSMRRRCRVDPHYTGINVCERWKDFENFYADMGDPPVGTSLDRIDNAKGYEPGNCRWATPKEQAINRCSTVMITFNNKTMCASDWAKEIGISRKGLMKRFKKNWPPEKVLSPKKYERVNNTPITK